eukprot:TRINITY_DN1904_c0_g1_i1.p1 TRINITY_DN1904_c0_g1~~TRINITY_DN1904_c0_g1_i1.p1  ORF type:complete len:719 (+),score=123.13 TRINITY_DN1904_c0_g1_i1:564-2720(+)
MLATSLPFTYDVLRIKAVLLNAAEMHIELTAITLVCQSVYQQLCSSSDTRAHIWFCKLLREFPICRSAAPDLKHLVTQIIQWMSGAECVVENTVQSHAVELSSLIAEVWHSAENSDELLLTTLYALFAAVLSANASPELHVLLQQIPVQCIDQVAQSALALSDEVLVVGIGNMFGWPLNSCTVTWLSGILDALENAGRYELVNSLTKVSIDSVLRQFQPQMANVLFPLFARLLMHYQHSPDVFHSSIRSICDLLQQLSEKLQHKVLFNELVDLCQCMMHCFCGYPELYAELLFFVEKHRTLTVEDMNERLARRGRGQARKIDVRSSVSLDVMRRTSASVGGLINLGNTCYANSFLQAALATDMFCALLLSTPILAVSSAATKTELARVFALLQLSRRASVSPFRLLKCLPAFSPGEQQDSNEFGRALLERIEEEDGQFNHLIKDCFGGIITNVVRCHGCQTITRTQEPFLDLVLRLPEGDPQVVTVDRLMRNWSSPCLLSGDNMFACGLCKERCDGEQWTVLTTPPVHLLITVNRFEYDRENARRKKLQHKVALDEYLTVADSPYRLYAVIVHAGTSAYNGHYYTYARHSTANSVENEWRLCNDSSVTVTTFSAMRQALDRFPHDAVYMLWYSRVNQPFVGNYVDASVAAGVREDDALFVREIDFLNNERTRQYAARQRRSQQEAAMFNSMFTRTRHDDDDPASGAADSLSGGPSIFF